LTEGAGGRRGDERRGDGEAREGDGELLRWGLTGEFFYCVVAGERRVCAVIARLPVYGSDCKVARVW